MLLTWIRVATLETTQLMRYLREHLIDEVEDMPAFGQDKNHAGLPTDNIP